MKVLSLFDGISVLRCALGDRPVQYFASEIDKYAIEVSKKNYPDIKQLGDVKTVKDVSGVYLLCGGSPCQDLSIAKKDRKGLKGDRSGLFYQYLRILKESKPNFFILENVYSMPKEDRDIITTELGVEPIMIDAALVSAQSRKRLFWTNIPVKGLPTDRSIKLKDILLPESEVEDKYYTTSTTKRVEKNTKTPGAKTGVYEVMTEVKKENPAFNQIGYFGAENACGVGGQALRVYDTEKKSPTSGVGLFEVGVSIRAHKQGEEWVNKVEHRTDDKASALTQSFSGKLALVGTFEKKEVKRIRRLTPVECERLQSLPDNYTRGISNTQRYRCLGNAFNCEVMRFILSFLPDQ